jgi:molybdopterin-guanine dinucleotide biosynthesis protein A
MIADASAAVLAGGLATRMGGRSKALLEVGGRTILARQLEVLRALFAEVVVIAPDAAPFASFGVPVVADRLAGRGAPGGVHAALGATRSTWVFCLACDMPFVRAEAISLLAGHREGARAVVPVRDGFLEPLFAFYSTALRDDFARALQSGSPSLAQLLQAARAVRVAQGELELVDPGCRSLQNVNTPADLARAQSS